VPCTSGMGMSATFVPCPAAPTLGIVQADVVAAYVYWETIETTAAPSSANGWFDGHASAKSHLASRSDR